MNCRHCHTPNPESAHYCRYCRQTFVAADIDITPPSGKSVLELYPTYHFISTNAQDWKEPWWKKFWNRFSILPLVVFLLFLLYCIVSCNKPSLNIGSDCNGKTEYSYGDKPLKMVRGWDYNRAAALREFQSKMSFGPIAMFSVGIALFSFIFFYTRRSLKRRKTATLKSQADYIQHYTYSGFFTGKLYRFIVKDGKFGLVDCKRYKVCIPPQYDLLEWRDKNKLLYASLRGQKYIIDISNNVMK